MTDRKRWGVLIRVAVSVVLLAILFRAVDIRMVAAVIRHARVLPLVGAIACYCVAGTYVRGERWRALVEAQGMPFRTTRAMSLSLIGTLFGQALPTGVGGDVVRALGLASDGLPRARAFGTVVVDRALGLLPLLATGLVVLALAPGQASPAVSVALLVAGATGLAAMVVLLRVHRWRGRLDRVPVLGWVLRRPSIARFIDSFADYDTRALARATAWSLAFIALLIVTNFLLGRAVGIDSAAVTDWMIVVPLVSLSLLLPSIGGWGVREMSYVTLLQSLDPPVDIHAATAMSILFGGLNLLLAAGGAVLIATGADAGLGKAALAGGTGAEASTDADCADQPGQASHAGQPDHPGQSDHPARTGRP